MCCVSNYIAYRTYSLILNIQAILPSLRIITEKMLEKNQTFLELKFTLRFPQGSNETHTLVQLWFNDKIYRKVWAKVNLGVMQKLSKVALPYLTVFTLAPVHCMITHMNVLAVVLSPNCLEHFGVCFHEDKLSGYPEQPKERLTAACH